MEIHVWRFAWSVSQHFTMKLKTYIALTLLHQNLKCNCDGKHTLVSNNTTNIRYIHIVTRSLIKRGIIKICFAMIYITVTVDWAL